MSKYIIEIDDNLTFDPQFIQLVGAECTGTVRIRHIEFDTLVELDSDYINEHFGELQDEAYQAGLNDMWDAVKKISLMTSAEAEEVFAGAGSYNRYNLGYSGVEAMDAYKAYLEKKDRIEVGDEVEWDGDKYVVTYLNYDIETSEITDYDLLAYDGSVVDHVKKRAFTKTGKHYDIASILEAMRE